MQTYYYGTVPALAWMLGHYFYAGLHYAWLAFEYFPYRLPNPKSSNPHLIYQDLYQPWRDQDDFDKTVNGYRFNLRKGVAAQESAGTITPSIATRLKDVCDLVDIMFSYPVVYRVDISKIAATRLKSAGSALLGSAEVLVPDLAESEFDVLFLDDTSDADLVQLVQAEVSGASVTASADALMILEARC